MSEAAEKLLDIMDKLAKIAPAFSDLYLMVFIQYRNLVTGANTITESGLTSPNSGLMQEWPTIGPNGLNLGTGSPGGQVTPLPATQSTVETYKGWTIKETVSGGKLIFQGFSSTGRATPQFSSVPDVEAWIDQNGGAGF